MVTFLAEAGVRGVSASAVVEPPLDRTDEIIEAISNIDIPTVDMGQINSIADGVKYLHSELIKLGDKVDVGLQALKVYTDDQFLLKKKCDNFYQFMEDKVIKHNEETIFYVYNNRDTLFHCNGRGSSDGCVLVFEVLAGKDTWTGFHHFFDNGYEATFKFRMMNPDGTVRVVATVPC